MWYKISTLYCTIVSLLSNLSSLSVKTRVLLIINHNPSQSI